MSNRRPKGEGSISYNKSKKLWQGSYQTPDTNSSSMLQKTAEIAKGRKGF